MSVIKVLAVFSLFTCDLQLILTADPTPADRCTSWSYNSYHGVASTDWMTGGCCLNTPGIGNSQSPIDINPDNTLFNEVLGNLSLVSYNVTSASAGVATIFINNGHTAQVNFAYTPGFAYNISGGFLPEPYILAQLHFHWGKPNTPSQGSEHTLWGFQYPMEVHFVHYRQSLGNLSNAANKVHGLAVLGFFYQLDFNDNAMYNSLIYALHDIQLKGQSKILTLTNRLSDLIPTDTRLYYSYSGSLTTPKCYESVLWSVFHNNILISSRQLSNFMALHENTTDTSDVIVDNFRPVQPLNGRTVYKSMLEIPSKTTTIVPTLIPSTKQAGGSQGNGVSVHACFSMITMLVTICCMFLL